MEKNLAEEYRYKTSAGGITLTKYLGSDTEVTIPTEHEGVPVVGLEGTFLANKGIATVRIPDSVTSIGEHSFDHCPALTIYGTPGSCAEEYARNYGIAFSAAPEPAHA